MNFDNITPAMIIGLVVVILFILFVVVAIVMRNRRERTRDLRLRFGSEYDLLLQQSNSRRDVEKALLAREKRVRALKIRDLNPAERTEFLASWEHLQSHFVDYPRGAVIEADELINSILKTRGFPAERFERRVADLSVDHSNLVESYRSANEITVRAGGNAATTEELRTAMLYYHSLFDDLLNINSRAEQRELTAMRA